MKSVTITLLGGDTVTWSKDGDKLVDVQVDNSGALLIYADRGQKIEHFDGTVSPSYSLVRGLSIGTWLDFSVEYDD